MHLQEHSTRLGPRDNHVKGNDGALTGRQISFRSKGTLSWSILSVSYSDLIVFLRNVPGQGTFQSGLHIQGREITLYGQVPVSSKF